MSNNHKILYVSYFWDGLGWRPSSNISHPIWTEANKDVVKVDRSRRQGILAITHNVTPTPCYYLRNTNEYCKIVSVFIGNTIDHWNPYPYVKSLIHRYFVITLTLYFLQDFTLARFRGNPYPLRELSTISLLHHLIHNLFLPWLRCSFYTEFQVV